MNVWASLYMTQQLAQNATLASLALTIFWAMVTVGRTLFAAIGNGFLSSHRADLAVIVAAVCRPALLRNSDAKLGAALRGGLGCSALLPLTVGFGQKELTTIAASVAGGLIAFYQSDMGSQPLALAHLDAARAESARDFRRDGDGRLVMATLSFVVVDNNHHQRRYDEGL
jgi:hypothetical protein